jgi:glycosyltransferase involved in cell wall biosynthesis
VTTLVVNIHANVPPYAIAGDDDPPDVRWDRADGTWLGVWTREWPDVLGEAVLAGTDRLAWDVWQPDVRADRAHAVTLPSGVTHRLFPAQLRTFRPGVLACPAVDSDAILDALVDLPAPALVLLHGFRVPFHIRLLERVGPRRRWPIAVVAHGTCTAPISQMSGVHRPLTYVSLLAEQRRLSRALRHVDLLLVQSEQGRRQARRTFDGPVEPLTMGCDFEFWRPAPSAEARTSARRAIGAESHHTVFLTTSNFAPVKRLDRLVQAVDALRGRRDVLLVIAGHGEPSATERLRARLAPMIESGRAILHPYATGTRLRDLHWAADAYVAASSGEGASVAIMKAMACGLPVVCTPVGGTAELMRASGAGAFLPPTDERRWPGIFTALLDHGLPRALDRDIARDAYDWPHVARRFLALCERLLPARAAAHV